MLFFGVSSIAFFWLSYLGLARGLAPGAAAIAMLLLLGLCSGRRAAAAPARVPPLSGQGRAEVALLASVVLSAVLALAIVLVWNAARPHGDHDAIAMWNVKARFAFHAAEPITAVLHRLDDALHPDYPLLVSLSVATSFRLLGAEPAWVSQAHGLLALVGLSLTLFVAVRASASRRIALATVALLLSTPIVLESAAAQTADLPLAYLVVLGALLLDRVREPRLMVLGGFALGCAVWTKNEGALFATALVLATILRARRERDLGLRYRALGAAAGGAVLGIATWLVFTIAVGRENDLRAAVMDGFVERVVDLGRWRQVLSALAEQLFGSAGRGDFGLSWFVFVGVALLLWRRQAARDGDGEAHARRCLWLGCGGLAVWVAIFALTPKDLEWHLRTAGSRLLLQIWPLFAVGMAGVVGAASREQDRLRRIEPRGAREQAKG
jgi:4-amino-4-deoxy-L-arabinose transferase-like glycosyltransferase